MKKSIVLIGMLFTIFLISCNKSTELDNSVKSTEKTQAEVAKEAVNLYEESIKEALISTRSTGDSYNANLPSKIGEIYMSKISKLKNEVNANTALRSTNSDLIVSNDQLQIEFDSLANSIISRYGDNDDPTQDEFISELDNILNQFVDRINSSDSYTSAQKEYIINTATLRIGILKVNCRYGEQLSANILQTRSLKSWWRKTKLIIACTAKSALAATACGGTVATAAAGTPAAAILGTLCIGLSIDAIQCWASL